MNTAIPLSHLLAAGSALFAIGLVGLLLRRNLLLIFLSIELLLAAVNLHLVGLARSGLALAPAQGDAIALFVILLAACEVAVGLALFVRLEKRLGTTDSEMIRRLFG